MKLTSNASSPFSPGHLSRKSPAADAPRHATLPLRPSNLCGSLVVMANTPDQDVLEAAFKEWRLANYPDKGEGEAFEYYSATQILKEYSPSTSEIADGVVKKAKDGGIDSFYVVLNENEILAIDSPVVTGQASAIKAIAPEPRIDVFVIQSKWSASWKSDPITRARDALTQLLPWGADEATLEKVYETTLLERTRIYRSLYANLLPKSPMIHVHFYYATKGAQESLEASADQANKANLLKLAVEPLLPSGGTAEAQLLGATGMCKLLRYAPAMKVPLQFSHDLVRAASSFVGLVKMSDYLRFIHREDSSELRPGLFESNVRDFAGETAAVNKAIKDTVTSDTPTSFWWLNNGVTILADEVEDVPPHAINLTRPLIVNGLQTTNVIHLASIEKSIPDLRLEQSLLVRVITAADSFTRDQVIAGTNRQTNITNIQLKATEFIHVEIEEYLATRGWYYERRKNQYRKSSHPAARIVSINQLAQGMIAVALGRPADARARPSSLISKPEIYAAVFPEDAKRPAYAAALELLQAVDEFLKLDSAKAIMDDSTNARFYVAVGYFMKKLRLKKVENINFFHNFARVDPKSSDPTFLKVLNALSASYTEEITENPGQTRDQVFKGPGLTPRFLAALYKS
ncbi:AIPR family protein [Microbacterium sp. P26]|uniref:AIPR family protein n=1 Tax=Microbacterium TaxID=33882 RepID=UPI00203F2EF8|nr:AIPR family protein [Microbacterium sp. P26]MCM3503069.1 AIPR family protein [Microbacterium sp. P26]